MFWIIISNEVRKLIILTTVYNTVFVYKVNITQVGNLSMRTKKMYPYTFHIKINNYIDNKVIKMGGGTTRR